MILSPLIITLTSDFGLTDEYVGVMKGVILNHNPDIRLVDISHQIPPQDIGYGSHLLARSFKYFPPGTVHLVVVDPGVGSERGLLAIKSEGYTFVGPDNGIFTPVLSSAAQIIVHRITNSDLFLANPSTTFHGRDIMAPVAAQLATGLAMERVGPEITTNDCIITTPAPCQVIDGVLIGTVSHIDSFGNLCTNISRQEVDKFSLAKKVTVHINTSSEVNTTCLCSSYADQPPGTLLALYDSHEYLEIAQNMGSAAELLQVTVGCQVTLKRA